MVISAVLPPSTGWGFTPKTDTKPTEETSKDAQTVFFSAGETAGTAKSSLKRKVSLPDRTELEAGDGNEEPSMDSDLFNNSFERLTTSSGKSRAFARPHRTFKAPKVTKRARKEHVQGKKLPILRVVDSLDKKGLQNLIEQICQSNPQVADQITNLAPRVTVSSALETLKKDLEKVFANLPYKGDQRNDYAYLRVRPALEEFFQAMKDYTGHFLPPNEQQPSNTLAFLDDATSLLHKIPTWNNALHNHQRNTAYDDISAAWCIVIKEASKRAGGLGLAHGGWEAKLQRHNLESGGRLGEAMDCIDQELSWLGGDAKTANLVQPALSAPNGSNL